MIHVVDTHSLVWFLEGDPRLSPVARTALLDPTVQVVVPTIVLVEIRYLYSRHRITIDLPTTLAHLHRAPNCKIHALDETVAQHLPLTLNIHDAIIVATALVYRDVLGENTALITKDAQIAASGLVSVIW